MIIKVNKAVISFLLANTCRVCPQVTKLPCKKSGGVKIDTTVLSHIDTDNSSVQFGCALELPNYTAKTEVLKFTPVVT